MGEPLAVAVRAGDSRRAAGFVDELREELARRGVGAAEVRLEVSPEGSTHRDLSLRAEDGVERAAGEVLARLRERRTAGETAGPPSGGGARGSAVYSPEEEAEVRKRLEDLGYF